MKTERRNQLKHLWFVLLILAVLSPLGIWLPAYFKAGGAWGEWGADEIAEHSGYVPQKLKQQEGLWSAPVPDYGQSDNGRSHAQRSLFYVVSALAGVLLSSAMAYALLRMLTKGRR